MPKSTFTPQFKIGDHNLRDEIFNPRHDESTSSKDADRAQRDEIFSERAGLTPKEGGDQQLKLERDHGDIHRAEQQLVQKK